MVAVEKSIRSRIPSEKQPMAAPLSKPPVRSLDPKRCRERSSARRLLVAAGAALTVLGAAGMAHGAAAVNDPFERFNRRGFAVQMSFMRHGLGIIGVLYRALTPGPIGKAIHHMLVNLSEPVVIINDMLQLRPARAGAAAVRFVANSTIGVGGMIDVTGATGLPHHLSSFGDTLGRYGVRPGPYLFIPVIGPSTVRDLFGNVVDAVIDPLHFAVYPHRQEVSITVTIVGGLDQLVGSESDLRALLSNATDPYATLRSTYLQYRQAEVSGETEVPTVLPNLDEPAQPAPPATLPSGPGGDQAPALQSLPDQQDGQSHGQFPGALDQGQSDGHVGPEAKDGAEHGVTGFLNADPHGSDESGAAQRHDQGFQAENVQDPNVDPGHP
jgi:phospholipid-binding lipoprotein MlaA